MSPAAFVDANVPIYAAGREHVYKAPCARIILMVAERPNSFVTDVEVLQELVHRYTSSGRWALGRDVLRRFSELMHDRIEPVFEVDIHSAAKLADQHSGISARDFVHAAVMQRLGIDVIISADGGFDRLPGLTRLDPTDVAVWGNSQGKDVFRLLAGTCGQLLSTHSPHQPHRVHANQAVRGDHGHTLNDRLGNNEPIERVTMQVREFAHL